MRSLRIYISCLCLLLSAAALHSQNMQKIDSLRICYKNAAHDTSRFNALFAMGVEFGKKNPDSALVHLQKARSLCDKNIHLLQVSNNEINSKDESAVFDRNLARVFFATGKIHLKKKDLKKAASNFKESVNILRSINDQNTLSWVTQEIGYAYIRMDRFADAFGWVEESIHIRKALGNKKELASSYLSLGLIYHRQGDLDDALENYRLCQKLNEEIGHEPGMAEAMNNIGIVFSFQGEHIHALDQYKKSYEIYSRIGNKIRTADLLFHLGQEYNYLEDFSTAIGYFKKALDLKLESKDPREIAYAEAALGEAYTFNNLYKEGEAHLLKALKLAEEEEVKHISSHCYRNLALNAQKQGKIMQALQSGERALALAREVGDPTEIYSAAEILYNIHTKLAHYKEAYTMYELFVTYKDSVVNERNKQASFASRLKYEYEKKTLADSIKLSDEKKLYQSRLSETTANLKKEKIQRFSILGGLSLTLIFSITYLRRFRISKRQQMIIEQQKDLVDSERHQTLAGLNYAQKIQEAILPSSKDLSAAFRQFYIYYKPKDIVSGDLYWFHEEAGLTFVAAVDCTGHGVPGAFMTMIAHSALLETIVEKKIYEPAQILSTLHHIIHTNLQQHKGGEYSQDGMDLSVAVIDKKNKVVHFAGARNNGFLIDGSEVRVMKATAASIGGLNILGEIESKRSFRQETFQLNSETSIVLCTDGIIDQLSDTDEKFGNKRFVEKMISMNRCKEHERDQVIREIENWRGGQEQLDDMLFLMLKV